MFSSTSGNTSQEKTPLRLSATILKVAGAYEPESLLGKFINIGSFLSIFTSLTSFVQSDLLKTHKGKRIWVLIFRNSREKKALFLTARLSRENETFSDSSQQKHPREKNLSEVTKLCGQKKKERETELGCLGAGWGPSQ